MSPKDKKVKEVITGYVESNSHPMIQSIFEAWRNNESYFAYTLDANEVRDYYEKLSKVPGYRFPKIDKYPDRQMAHCFYFEHGNIFVYSEDDLSEEQKLLLHRFTKVFSLTYKRYLDLKNAEAQVMEARIEAALERVRSRTMGMQRSDELQESALILFQQIKALGVDTFASGFNIWDDDKKAATAWMAGDERIQTPFKTTTAEDIYLPIYEAEQRGESLYVLEQSGRELEAHYEYLKNIPEVKKMWQAGLSFPTYQIIHCAFFSQGYLMFISYKSVPDAHDIFKRFAAVFEQTYTRFLDLQKAEEQAREAQIEAALEKVRGRAMAMHKSDELLDVGALLYQELIKLGIENLTSGYVLMDEDEKIGWNYLSDPVNGKIGSKPLGVPHQETKVMRAITKSWRKQNPYLVIQMDEKGTIEHQTFIAEHTINFNLTPEELIALTPEKLALQTFNFKEGYLLIVGAEPLTDDQIEMILRFAKVFEMTYRRFLDLQKAEAQAREAQIEVALERVRARAMAMHKSEELAEAAELLYRQLQDLGINPWTCGYVFIEEEKEQAKVWMTEPNGKFFWGLWTVPLREEKVLKDRYKSWKRTEDIHISILKGQDNIDHHIYIAEHSPINLDEFLPHLPADLVLTSANFSHGYLLVITELTLSIEEEIILKRFAKVFELTYTRFLDLQNAEALTREAQIETALEKVRSRSLAMHKSEQLPETAKVLFEEFESLGKAPDRIGFVIINEEVKEFEVWGTDQIGSQLNHRFRGSLDEPTVMSKMYIAWKKGKDSNVIDLSGQDLKDWMKYTREIVKLPVDDTQIKDRRVQQAAFFSHGMILFTSNEPVGDETMQLLVRFAKVFDQAYTRFLDLQKAEAQVKEALVENALEKVRSRSLAMHKSNELEEVASIVLEKLQELDIPNDGEVAITLINENTKDLIFWLASPEQKFSISKFILPYANLAVINAYWDARANGLHFFTKSYSYKEKNEFFKWAFMHSDFKYLPEERKNYILEQEDYSFSSAWVEKSGIHIPSFTGKQLSEKEGEILKRFATVFEQSYVRFLDLQKAEAQAREAQIESALESIRSKALAMQSSSDLIEVSNVLRDQMGKLGQSELESSIVHIYNNPETFEAWYTFRSTETNSSTIVTGKAVIPIDSCDYIKETIEKYNSKEAEYTIVSEGEKLFDWYNTLTKVAPDTVEYDEKGKMIVPDILYYHHSKFSGGALLMISNEKPSDESKELQRRAAIVFNLAFQRFRDLQKAEAQARDAVKQASLDRVRGEIASMRSTEDLERITPLIWKELTALDVPFIRCGVFIMDEKQKIIESHLSTPDGKSLGILNLPYEADKVGNNAVEFWRKGKIYKDHWNRGQFVKFMQKMVKLGRLDSPEMYQGATVPPKSLDLHFVPFKQGMLYVGNIDPLKEDEIQLVQSLAEAFSIAYARYEDFTQLEKAKNQIENALGELKSTQTQLIHSEKMASLGELTAGIAHEIQNPLNFVNNFSEVSEELLNELEEELEKGKLEEVKEISADIIENLKKIHHHGQRASGIVKGMLEHSRTGDGKTEPTDINTLVDEYLRLAYHGLRAKDKSFNADFKTDFDDKLPKLNLISQDIGRVLLNLINNAFYAVDRKAKHPSPEASDVKATEDSNYKPQVSVSTMKAGDKVEIRVKDNGDGIPEKVRDKIFQPFFTTKPTGSGTGLGLSLSYDIIKAHGGEFKVTSKETEGAEFIIILPC